MFILIATTIESKPTSAIIPIGVNTGTFGTTFQLK
jgi:hypothetical protein